MDYKTSGQNLQLAVWIGKAGCYNKIALFMKFSQEFDYATYQR